MLKSAHLYSGKRADFKLTGYKQGTLDCGQSSGQPITLPLAVSDSQSNFSIQGITGNGVTPERTSGALCYFGCIKVAATSIPRILARV
jgi:hypothetical protein